MFVEQRGSSIFDEKETKKAYVVFLLLTALLLIAGCLTGCGGGGSSTSTVQTIDPSPTSTLLPTPTPTGHSPSPSPTPVPTPTPTPTPTATPTSTPTTVPTPSPSASPTPTPVPTWTPTPTWTPEPTPSPTVTPSTTPEPTPTPTPTPSPTPTPTTTPTPTPSPTPTATPPPPPPPPGNHKLVFKKALCNLGNPALYAASIAVAINGNTITYIVINEIGGASKVVTFNAAGNVVGTTGSLGTLFGVGYLNGYVYVTQESNDRILKFAFNSTTQTIVEPAEKTITWGSTLSKITIVNGSIYINSYANGVIGKFDANLNVPPLASWNLDIGSNGVAVNYNESRAWAANSSGRVETIDLTTGQKEFWSNSVGRYPWEIVAYQNTLFFTSQVPQELEWYKQDGTPLGSVTTTGYNPTGICIYNNPVNGKTEAAVTFWEGQIWIYEVQEI